MSSMMSTLGEVADFINGAAFKPEDWGDNGARIIRIQNLTDKAKPYNRTTRSVSERIQVQPGDLLVSWSATLGVFEWSGPDVGYLNQHIFRVVPDSRRVDKRYLRFALELALLDMRKHLHGATMLHVNRGEFLSTRVFVPALSEQRRIAAILDKAVALRAKRQQALNHLDRLEDSVFVEMFGDPATNPKGWARKPLSEFVAEDDSINYGVVQPGEDVRDGIPLVRVGDLVDGKISHETLKHIAPEIERTYSRSRLKGDEILVSCVGSIGVVALASPQESGFNIARAVARIRVGESAAREFVAAHLATAAVQRYFTQELRTVSQPTLNIKQLAETQMLCPPLPMQRLFASRICAIRAAKERLVRSLDAMQCMFGALQHRAFLGEL